jgi:hypothetical protein
MEPLQKQPFTEALMQVALIESKAIAVRLAEVCPRAEEGTFSRPRNLPGARWAIQIPRSRA